MTRNGTLFLLPPLVRLTSVIASGSSRALPTPRAADHDAGAWRPDGRGPNLLGALMPTPTASTYGSNQGGGMGRVGPVRYSLEGMAQRGLIPTPLASDSEEAGGIKAYLDGVRGLSLTTWARIESKTLLPSPSASDDRTCADYSDRSRGHSPQLRHLGKGRLNPRFVEWMMGLPEDWTALD